MRPAYPAAPREEMASGLPSPFPSHICNWFATSRQPVPHVLA
ncbi:MAG TPA: hypothetical protein VF503_03620 [Sphingobium sp.]